MIKSLKLWQPDNFTQEKNIVNWLNKYEVERYTLLSNSAGQITVDVDGVLDLKVKKLKQIAVKFGKVSGNFLCSNNELKTLHNSPYFVGGDVDCSGNYKLKSLDGGPKIIIGQYDCSFNAIENFDMLPQKLVGRFLFYNNPLSPRFSNVQKLDDIKEIVRIQSEKDFLGENINPAIKHPKNHKI